MEGTEKSQVPLKEYTFKVVLLGTSGVGKTSVISRIVDHQFIEEEHTPTIGVAFKSYVLNLEDKVIKMPLWDTAGQEKYRTLTKQYFRGAVGGLLVYDITSRESFDDLQEWLSDLETNASPHISIILIGNKTDLEDQRVISYTEANEFAERHHLGFIETSVKNNLNVEEAFYRLALSMVHKQEEAEASAKQSADTDKVIDFSETIDRNENTGCGC